MELLKGVSVYKIDARAAAKMQSTSNVGKEMELKRDKDVSSGKSGKVPLRTGFRLDCGDGHELIEPPASAGPGGLAQN